MVKHVYEPPGLSRRAKPAGSLHYYFNAPALGHSPNDESKSRAAEMPVRGTNPGFCWAPEPNASSRRRQVRHRFIGHRTGRQAGPTHPTIRRNRTMEFNLCPYDRAVFTYQPTGE